MAAIDALINKAKAITEKENKLLAEYLKKKYAEVTKVFSFNTNWSTRHHPTAFNIIHHPEWRLIMQHGDVAKIEINRFERYLVMGTYFGTVVIEVPEAGYPRYTVTQAFADAWALGYGKKCPTVDWFDVKSPHFLDDEFFAHVAELADMEVSAGRPVGDGMIVPTLPARKVATVARHKKYNETKRGSYAK